MGLRAWVRVALVISSLNVGFVNSSMPLGLTPGHAAPLPSMPAAVVPGTTDDILHAAALWAPPANVLPLALSGALGAQRRLPAQIAEGVAPAYRNAQGSDEALATLAAQTLRGQGTTTPDPLARMGEVLADTLGPVGAIFAPRAEANTAAGSGLSDLTSGLVDLGSGSLHLAYQDLSIPSRGSPLALQRTFAPLRRVSSAMGAGWTFTYGVRLAFSNSGAPIVQEADGATTHFALWQAPSTYQATDSQTRESLILQPDGSATRLFVDGSTEQFDTLGRLSQVRSGSGEGLTMRYTGRDLTSVIDGTGRSLSLAYDARGLIRQVTDPLGATVGYSHDAAGNLIAVTDPLGRITQYRYSDPAPQSYDVPLLRGITLPRGTTIAFSYDLVDRVARIAGPGTLLTTISYTTDAATGTTRAVLTDRLGARTVIDTTPSTNAADCIAAAGATAQSARPCAAGARSDAGVSTRLTDATGVSRSVLRSATQTLSLDAEQHLSSITRDLSGRPVQLATTRTGSQNLGYDQTNSTLTSVTGSGGPGVTFGYDGNGALRTIRDGMGAMTHIDTVASSTYRLSRPSGQNSTVEINPSGLPILLTGTAGQRTALNWDLDGRLTRLDDPGHGALTFRYDAAGQLSARTDAAGATTSYSYDPDGNLTAVRDASGQTWRFSYDVRDLLISVTDPLHATTRFGYDAAGRLVTLTNARGATTAFRYDAAGRLTTMVDPLRGVTSYRYGPSGELLAATTPLDHQTELHYDAAGRLAEVVDPTGQRVRYGYDTAGRLTTIQRADGSETRVAYDAAGRLARRTATDDSGASYSYDAAGNLSSATNAGGTLRLAYDRSGALIQSTDAAGHRVRYTYDSAGRRATMIGPDGAFTRYSYDAMGHLKGIADSLGNSSFSYDARGLRVAATLPGGITARYSYDAIGRPTNISYRHGAHVVAGFSYRYDAVGNVLEERTGNADRRFSYDPNGRLTAVAGPQGSTAAYRYDADGNLISSPLGSDWRYDAADRLMQAGRLHFTYTAGGYLATASDGTRYQFDGVGELRSLRNSTGTVSYIHDPLGRQVQRTANGKMTYTIYDNSDPIAVMGPGSGATQRLLYGPGVDEPLAGTAGRTALVYLTDRLGTVSMALDRAGTRTLTQNYDAYGHLLGRQGGAGIAPGYVGRPADPVSGLVDLRSRLYDPAHGRFVSPDPAAAPGAPGYIYVADSPLTFKDPLGLGLFGISDGDISWGGTQAGTIGGGASILGNAPFGSGTGVLGNLGNGLGYVGAASAIANAMNNPSQSSAANAGIASAGAAIGRVCGACAAPVFVGQTYAGAFQNFVDAGNAFNTGDPDGSSGSSNSSSGTTSPSIGNLDPSFIQPSEAMQTGNAAWTMTAGSPTPLSLPLPISSPGRAAVTIFDAQGQRVRTLALARPAAPPVASISWDGRDSGGHPVPPGQYFILLDLQPDADPAADLTTLRTVTVMSAPSPAPRIAALNAKPAQVTARIGMPADGSLVRGSVPIVGEAAGPDFDHYIVDYSTVAQPDTWVELASGSRAVQPDGPISLPRQHTLFGNLATLDAGLSNYRYDFDPNLKRHAALDGLLNLRLRVFSRHGTVAEARSRVIVGRVAPYVSDSLVDSPDGQAVLSVPSMAIHGDAQLFAVERVSAPPAPPGFALAGNAYAIYPAGYSFATPATMRLNLPAGAKGARIFAWSAATRSWRALATSSARSALLATTGAEQSLYAALVPSGPLPAPILFAPSARAGSGGSTLLAGVAPAGTSVRLLDNGQPLGSTVRAGGDGAFQITVPLAGGLEHIVQAVATDLTGRSSLASSPITLRPLVRRLSLTSLRARSADFSAPAPTTLGQGDLVGIEARLAPGASANDGLVVHVRSLADGAGLDILLRGTGGVYRGLLAIGAAPASSPVPDLPSIAARGNDKIRISAGDQTLAIAYRDRAAPGAPVIRSRVAPAGLRADLAQSAAAWPAPATPLDAVVQPMADGGSGHNQALRIRAGATGDLTTPLPMDPFDLRAYPTLSFAYNVPITVSVNLAVHANGVWWVLGLSDMPPTVSDTGGLLFADLWNSQQRLVRDGRWHQISLDLYALLRRVLPTSTITVDRMAFGDWQPGGWMAVQPSHANAPGAAVLLDDLALPAVTRAERLQFTWPARDPSGIGGYSVILDQKPNTVPPAKSQGLATQSTVGPLASGTWWVHVRAQDAAGNWSAPAHYPFVVDTLAPQAGDPSPAPGTTGDATFSVQLRDPGGSGIDPASLRFRAFGKVYGPESGAVTYDPASGQASLSLAVLQPTPPGLFPGGQVPVALVAAADVAGNTLRQPLAWTYTMDIPTSLPGGPQLLTRQGGEMPSLDPASDRVAFISSRQGGTHLWTIGAGDLAERQQTARQITSGSSAEADPAWSPDGKAIAFGSTRGGGSHIWLVAPDGSDPRQITTGPGTDAHPTWSPDGKRLAIVRNGDLWVVDRDGGNARALLADGDHAVREPAWSPDGAHIAFRHSLYVDQIWLVDADGRHPAALTTLAQGEAQSSPAWLADGRVAYVSQRHEVSAIYAVRADGTAQLPLVGQPPARLLTPNASHDGAATTFASTSTGIQNIWISRQFIVEPFDTDTALLDPAAGGTVTLHWGISLAANVSISVVDSGGRTVRTLVTGQRRAGNATVHWDGRDGRGKIASQGTYSLQLAARAPGLPPLQRGVGVTLDEVSLHGTVRVQTMLAGQPTAGVTLIAYTSGAGGTYVAQAITDSSGAASLSLSAGTYDLLAQAAGGATARVTGIVVTQRASQQRTIALAVPAIGVPTAQPGNPTPDASPTSTAATATPGMTPAPTGTPAPSTSPTATVLPAVTKSPATGQGTLALTVVLAPGHPAANAAIRVLRGGKVVASANADSQGKATLSLPAGQYTVTTALEAAEGSITVSVSGGASTASVLNLRAGTLQLVVRQADGQPAAYSPIYMLQGTKSIYDTGTNSEGQASAILPAGSYTIQAGTPPHNGTVTARLAAGATLTVTLKLH